MKHVEALWRALLYFKNKYQKTSWRGEDSEYLDIDCANVRVENLAEYAGIPSNEVFSTLLTLCEQGRIEIDARYEVFGRYTQNNEGRPGLRFKVEEQTEPWIRGVWIVDWDYFRPVPERRPTIPKPIREFVLARDGRECQVCSSKSDLTLDHIKPFSLGGSDTSDNLRVLCRSCNSRKGARI